MNQRFSFGKGKRKTRKKLPAFLRNALVLLIVFAVALSVINLHLRETLLHLSEKEAESYFSRRFASTVQSVFGKSGILYSDLIHLTYKTDGTVAALETDYFRCHAVCAEATLSIADILKNPHRLDVSIPMGNLSGIAFLSDTGPDLTVSVHVQSGFTAHLQSSFSEVGINQTRHKILLVVDIKITLLFPGNNRDAAATVKIPIAETVLLGNVPDAFTQIDRLTDDITEDEIEDIYDFGAEK